jgi:hypothetical protein
MHHEAAVSMSIAFSGKIELRNLGFAEYRQHIGRDAAFQRSCQEMYVPDIGLPSDFHPD